MVKTHIKVNRRRERVVAYLGKEVRERRNSMGK